MTFVDDLRKTFDAADFCEVVKAGVGEGRITSNIALRDSVAVSAAVKQLQDFANLASAAVGPDVIAAYVTYSPNAPEVFTALRAISVHPELVAAALECLILIVKYSLDGSKPQQPLEQARSVVKEIVKSRAVLIYDILATDGKACAKKALNLLRLVAICHPVLAKELVNRFDLSAKSMAPSLCSVTNNHCRVPFLDLMFVILASGERDVLHYLAGKGREVIVTCLRTIQERATLEAGGGVGSATKLILWKQGNIHQSKQPKIQPSHIQKRELIAAINFLLAVEKHLFVGLRKSNRGALAHPVPTILAALATAEIPPAKVAPREVLQEHEALRSTATRIFVSIAKDPRTSTPVDVVNALNNPFFDYGAETVVKFVSHVIQEKPQLAPHLLEAGRILSAPPALTLRWFGYFSVIASCILRLPMPITTFREKQFFEKCLGHPDPLIRHLGSVLAISFCKVLETRMNPEQHAEDYLPALETIQKVIRPGTNKDDLVHRLIASCQSLLRRQVVGTDVKLMTVSVDAVGDDIVVAAGMIEGALRTSPYSAVRKVVHKHYLSRLIAKASQSPQCYEVVKLWRVCSMALRCTDLFQPGTDAEIDVYLAVLSSLGKEAEEPAKAFEAVIAQALEMPYGLYDRLHSDEWSEESATIKTSQLTVATIIKLQKLAQKRSIKGGRKSDHVVEETLERMALCIVATSSVLHRAKTPNSYLAAVLPPILKSGVIWWNVNKTEEQDTDVAWESRRIATKLIHDRGTYPKTTFLKLIESLIAFDNSVDTKTTKSITYKANPELGLAWDSWCDHWLQCNSSSDKSSFKTSARDELSKRPSDFILQGVKRLMLDICYPRKIEMRVENDLGALRKVLTQSDYRFVTAMMLKTVEGTNLYDKLYEETLLQMSDMLSYHASQPEENEFFYESVLRSVAERPNWSAKQVNKMMSFCISVLSKWDSLTGWIVHAAYATALMKALLSHCSIDVSVRARVFLATRTVDSLPPLTKLTLDTVKNLIVILEHSPYVRRLAVAQVYGWPEKEHRSCNGVLLRLLSTALHSTVREKNIHGSEEEKLLRSFIKASLKSKTVWISNGSTKDDKDNLHALDSIASVIGQTRKLCELFLHRLFRTRSVSRNSWLLLGSIVDPFKLSGTGLEITSRELGSLLSLVIRYVGNFTTFEDGYPELSCLHVLESVTQHLRLQKFSFYNLSSSIDRDMANVCMKLTACAQSRLSFLFSDSEMCTEVFFSEEMADMSYLASVFACLAEILKLDLSLESAAKDTLEKLSAYDGKLIRFCLQTDGVRETPDGFPRTRDLVIQLMSVFKAALSWLSYTKCDHNLATALLCMKKVLSSQCPDIISGRNERHSSVRECAKMISSYIRANDVEKTFSSGLRNTVSIAEAATVLHGLAKPMLEEAADYILQSSYQTTNKINVSYISSTKNLDPIFVLNTFLQGCREALIQLQAPVLDLHQIAKNGVLALALTGTASANQQLRTLSFACLEAFATVVGPATGVPSGSASGLYKDRKQLAFLLELFRNSISDPLTQVLPLFAVWFRTSTRIVLSPGHAANKLVATLLLRAPCLDVSDCYGLSHYLSCEASGSELQAIRLLAFEIIHKGVHSQRDVSVLRRRRVFDKVFMFAASAMGTNSSIRIAALRSLDVIMKRDEGLDIIDELVSSHGITVWLASDFEHVGETIEELFIKLNILRTVAKGFVRRRSWTYASVLAETLTLFAISRLKPTKTTERERQIAEGVAGCGALIVRVSPRTRCLFRSNFADIWSDYKLEKVLSFPAKRDLVSCICRQRDTVTRPGVLEMLLEYSIDEDARKNQANSDLQTWTDDLPMIHMFVADCLLAMRSAANKTTLVTSRLCNLLAMALYEMPTVWILLASITVLHLCNSLSDNVIACTDKIPAFLPLELKPHFDQQFSTVVGEMKLTVVGELIALADKLTLEPSSTNAMDGNAENYDTTNGIH